MAKPRLNLTIDADLLELAKASDLNLSAEFEEFLKIRLNQNLPDNEKIDFDKEYTRLQMELRKLESKKELVEKQDMKEQERLMVLDHAIDNELEIDSCKVIDIPENRANGIVYLFKKKFNENLTSEQAKKLLSDRIKERGLDG